MINLKKQKKLIEVIWKIVKLKNSHTLLEKP